GTSRETVQPPALRERDRPWRATTRSVRQRAACANTSRETLSDGPFRSPPSKGLRVPSHSCPNLPTPSLTKSTLGAAVPGSLPAGSERREVPDLAAAQVRNRRSPGRP